MSGQQFTSFGGHYTPLRYPGGKGKIAKFVAELVKSNHLIDGVYIEPYAGGAGVALELLFKGYVKKIIINDICPNIYSFWYSVLNYNEDLCYLIEHTDLTVEQWDKQKSILKRGSSDCLALGFATFFLNRTNRSGILNGGIIGGRAQDGNWRMNARYNSGELVRRIKRISRTSARISLYNQDAVDLIREKNDQMPKNSLIYFDPPYIKKGKHLYYNHYKKNDHLQIRKEIEKIGNQSWIVSYDDVPEIAEIYAGKKFLRYSIGYSALKYSRGAEIMFFSQGLDIPDTTNSMREIERGQ